MQDREGSDAARPAALVAAVVVGVALVGVLAFLALGNVLDDGGDDDLVTQGEVADVAEGALSPEAYRAVVLGVDEEALTERLLPVRPVESAVLDRYQTRSPEGVESSCVYYDAEGGEPDDLFRFCFEDDRLVDKAVVLPDQA